MSLRGRLAAHETLTEFEWARLERFQDSLVLRDGGRRLGAIYLLGYSVEMTLKSAFFSWLGFRADDAITANDLRAAAELVRKDLYVQQKPESFHNLFFWARAIIALRNHFDDPLPEDLARELSWRSQRMHSNWRVSMRYSRDVSREEEWHRFREDAHWMRRNYELVIEAGAN